MAPRQVAVDEVQCRSCGAARRHGEWCPRCLERYEQPAQPEPATDVATGFPPKRVPAPREYSRVKAGPSSFGPFGRLTLSAIPAIVAFVAVRNVMRSRHDATVAYYLVIAVPALVLVVGFLAFVWRRERVS